MNMIITNNNIMPPQFRSTPNPTNLASVAPKPSSALNSSIIKRIHNVKPGCGSCGRK